MNFQGVGAIFQFISHLRALSGKFLGFPNRNEACTQRVGDGRGEDKAAGFDTDHDVDACSLIRLL